MRLGPYPDRVGANLKKALNQRQQMFIYEYLVDQNATRSAKAVGYSERTAHAQGYALLKHPQVAAQIQKVLAAREARMVIRAEAKAFTKERWLDELHAVALANLDDLVTIKRRKIYVTRKNGSEYVVTEDVARLKATAKRDPALGRAIKKIAQTKFGIAIEMHSKQAALDTLGRAYGWVKDKVEIENLNEPQIVLMLPDNGKAAPPVVAGDMQLAPALLPDAGPAAAGAGDSSTPALDQNISDAEIIEDVPNVNTDE